MLQEKPGVPLHPALSSFLLGGFRAPLLGQAGLGIYIQVWQQPELSPPLQLGCGGSAPAAAPSTGPSCAGRGIPEL